MKTRDELIQEERAAEMGVREEEVRLKAAEATNDPEVIAEAQARIQAARTASLAVRQRVQADLDGLGKKAAEDEVLRHAREVGVPEEVARKAIANPRGR
ncbi:MAG: hypothetical protein ACSLFE_00435 [Gemmatimonadaceae bacterium]